MGKSMFDTGLKAGRQYERGSRSSKEGGSEGHSPKKEWKPGISGVYAKSGSNPALLWGGIGFGLLIVIIILAAVANSNSSRPQPQRKAFNQAPAKTLPLETKKQIWAEIWRNKSAASATALKEFPKKADETKTYAMNRESYKDSLVKHSESGIIKKYGITRPQYDAIYEEGSRSNWPK